MRFSLATDEAAEQHEEDRVGDRTLTGYWDTSGERSPVDKDAEVSVGEAEEDADIDGDKDGDVDGDGDDETSTSVTEECLTKSNIDTYVWNNIKYLWPRG